MSTTAVVPTKKIPCWLTDRMNILWPRVIVGTLSKVIKINWRYLAMIFESRII